MPISAKSWVGRSYHRRLVVVDIQQTGAGGKDSTTIFRLLSLLMLYTQFNI